MTRQVKRPFVGRQTLETVSEEEQRFALWRSSRGQGPVPPRRLPTTWDVVWPLSFPSRTLWLCDLYVDVHVRYVTHVRVHVCVTHVLVCLRTCIRNVIYVCTRTSHTYVYTRVRVCVTHSVTCVYVIHVRVYPCVSWTCVCSVFMYTRVSYMCVSFLFRVCICVCVRVRLLLLQWFGTLYDKVGQEGTIDLQKILLEFRLINVPTFRRLVWRSFIGRFLPLEKW